jgi:hypothetical protein
MAMSELHVRQIRSNLEKVFSPFIDVSDIATRPKDERTNCLLTRSLAAFAIAYLANVKPEDAAKAVTDGWHDNGLDAIFYHPTNKVLYLVQSKWRHDGSQSIDRGEMQKFLKGLKDLLNARWTRFNDKVRSRSHELDGALDDASTRIVLLITYTGQQGLSPEVSQDLHDVIDEINDPIELAESQVFRQADIYSAVAQGLEGAPIDVDVVLFDWGQIRDPYVGFYGQVSASDIGGWFGTHRNRLLSQNIRMFLGKTDVNDTIVNTLVNAPQDFWYFNNGITALCRTIKKKPIGGSTRETGYFECHDLRIVNGAQTVGAIAQAQTRSPDKVATARVAIRLISLENCPLSFDKDVTRYTNTQNRIDRRDFVALDVEQERIRGELQLEGVNYVYKSGESQPTTASGFDLVEATVARACLQSDVGISVQAKREIGKLWDDIEKPPYKTLFNPGVSDPALWRLVQITRQVERQLAGLRSTLEGRDRLLSVHGNRFITHLVLTRLPAGFCTQANALIAREEKNVGELTHKTFKLVSDRANELFPDAYLASVFKNANKCQRLKLACKVGK